MRNIKGNTIVDTDEQGNVTITKAPKTTSATPTLSTPLSQQDYNTLARDYANNAKREYENSLSYLLGNVTSSYNANKDALTNEYNNLVDTLNNNYQGNARQAYVNKMLSGEALNEHLANLGISTQGFGVGQRLNVENTYATNLANLQNELQGDLTDAGTNYQKNLASLYTNYQNNLSSVRSQIASGAEQAYNNALAGYADIYNTQLAKEQQTNTNKLYSMIIQQKAEDEARIQKFNDNRSILGSIWNTITGNGDKNNTWSDKVVINNLKKSQQEYPEQMANTIAQLYANGLINEGNVETLLKAAGYTENTTGKSTKKKK
jgi:hypothetical protein